MSLGSDGFRVRWSLYDSSNYKSTYTLRIRKATAHQFRNDPFMFHFTPCHSELIAQICGKVIQHDHVALEVGYPGEISEVGQSHRIDVSPVDEHKVAAKAGIGADEVGNRLRRIPEVDEESRRKQIPKVFGQWVSVRMTS